MTAPHRQTASHEKEVATLDDLACAASPSWSTASIAELRAEVRTAVGRRAAGELGRIDWVECANYSQLRNQLDAGEVDLAILDGDAQPTGGIGLCRQFKNEITDCPPIIVLLLRAAGPLAGDLVAGRRGHGPPDRPGHRGRRPCAGCCVRGPPPSP